MIFVADRDVGRNNNFNLVRMIAASGVLFSHAWPLALGKATIEPLFTETGYKLGTTCVTIFFAISGFFITKSFENRVSISDFVLARIARIYPALVVVLLLTVFLLGPLFTTLSLQQYFSDRHTWTYLPRNLSLGMMQWQLPGVFTTNPGGDAINGSLWTLIREVSCYGLIALAALMRLTKQSLFPFVLVILALSVLFMQQSEGGGLLHSSSTLAFPFALGSAAYIYRRVVPLSAFLVFGLAFVAVILRSTAFYPLIHAAALSYFALWCGFVRFPVIQIYNRLGDYSYGMYIYAFPVEQATIAIFPSLSPIQLVLMSFPVTLLLSCLSWNWIELPALAHRHVIAARIRLRRRQAEPS